MHKALEAVSQTFFDFTDTLSRQSQITRITIEALHEFKDRDWAAGIQAVDTSSIEGTMKLLQAFTRKQDIGLLQDDAAKVESLVYGQSIVTMWSTLESHIDDQLLALLQNDSSLLTGDEVKKVKISLGEFQAMDDDVRLEYLLEEAKLSQKAKLARGPAVFERTLKVFGFDGSVESETSRELVNFSAIRNCVAHRRGIVDRKFMASFIGSGPKSGELLVLTKQHVALYFFASLQYAATVFARAAAKYEPGLKIPSDYATTMLKYLKEEQAKS